MGAQQSSGVKDDGDDDNSNNNCHPCFLFKAPFGNRNNNSNDPLGSPLPDTPLSHRKKQREFSSQYGGLEKEVSSFKSPSLVAGNNNNNNNTSSSNSNHQNKSESTADVYDGAVCLFLFFYILLCICRYQYQFHYYEMILTNII
jgi:hypothetical protein